MKKKLFIALTILLAFAIIMTGRRYGIMVSQTQQAETSAYSFNVDVKETFFDGTKTWVIKDSTSQLIHIKFVFKNTGSAFEQKLGSLAMLSNMAFEGAGKLDAYHFQEFLSNHQLVLNIFSTNDDSVISLQTTPSNLKCGLEAISMIVKELRLEADSFKRTRERILIDLEQSKLEPRTLAEDKFRDFALLPHPYFKKINEQIEAIKSVTADDVKKALKDHFTVDRMSCIVLGNYDDKEVESFIKSVKGLLQPKSSLAQEVPQVAFKNSGKTKYFFMDVPQSMILFTMKGLVFTDPKFDALKVFNAVLGGNYFTSRVWTTIREDRGLAYFVRTSFVELRKASMFKGMMGTSTNQVEQALALLKETIENTVKKGITQKELDAQKRFLTGDFLTSFDSLSEMSSVLAQYITDFTLDDLKQHNERIAKLTLDEVNQAAKDYLHPEDLTFCILGNHDAQSAAS